MFTVQQLSCANQRNTDTQRAHVSLQSVSIVDRTVKDRQSRLASCRTVTGELMYNCNITLYRTVTANVANYHLLSYCGNSIFIHSSIHEVQPLVLEGRWGVWSRIPANIRRQMKYTLLDRTLVHYRADTNHSRSH